MPALNKPLKINGTTDLKEYLSQADIFASDKKIRVRVNHNKIQKLDEDIPVPSMLVDAIEITNEKGEKAALFTYLGDQSLRSFVIPFSELSEEPVESNFNESSTTDLFGAINTDKGFERAVELRDISHFLKKEEEDRKSISIFKVKVSNNNSFGGFTEINTRTVEAERIIHNQKIMYVIKNDMDNYLRPDLVTEDYLASEPEYVRSITPTLDKENLRKKEVERNIENQKLAKEKRKIEADKQKIIESEKAIESAKKISPDFLKKMQENKDAFSPQAVVYIERKIRDTEKATGMPLEIKIDKSKSAKEIIMQINTQCEKETFKAKNGFYIEAGHNEKSNQFFIRLIDKKDNPLMEIKMKDDLYKSKKVRFSSDEFESYENVDVINMEEFDTELEVIELSKIADEELRFEEFYHYATSLSFAENSNEAPLEYSDLIDINDLNGQYLMSTIEKNERILIGNEIATFMKSIDSKYENSSENSM